VIGELNLVKVQKSQIDELGAIFKEAMRLLHPIYALSLANIFIKD